jgi:hypothetical protein
MANNILITSHHRTKITHLATPVKLLQVVTRLSRKNGVTRFSNI